MKSSLQYLHGDLPTNHSHECLQPGSELYRGRDQVRPHHRCQHVVKATYTSLSFSFHPYFVRTCMMVLTSVYLSVSTSLPSTSNIKPVEVWLLFNLAYPFLVILVNVVIQVEILKCFTNEEYFLTQALEHQEKDNFKKDKLNDKIVQVESLLKPIDENEEQMKPFLQTDRTQKPKHNYKIIIFEIWARFLNPLIYLSFCLVYFIYHCAINQ